LKRHAPLDSATFKLVSPIETRARLRDVKILKDLPRLWVFPTRLQSNLAEKLSKKSKKIAVTGADGPLASHT
tara:strand:+ start:136 stop:351 length:216 start_codon:yes stop_codon:yes gene_type:complete